MKSKEVKITISFALFGTMTLLYEAKMAGLSSSDNKLTATLLYHRERYKSIFLVILIVMHKFNFNKLYPGSVFESTCSIS